MTSTERIFLWLLAFAVSHMGLASLPVRSRLVRAVGELPYLGLYSLVSFATFVPLVMAWTHAIHGGAFLWSVRTNPVVHVLALMVSWISFTLALAAVAQPSPASIGPRQSTRARGLTRITRHPLFMNIGIWALAHCVLNGFANDVLFFGGVFLVGLFGCMHQDARKRVTEKGVLDEFYAETSLLPFAAIATGRQRLVLSELPWTAITIAAVVSAAIYLLHGRMFG